MIRSFLNGCFITTVMFVVCLFFYWNEMKVHAAAWMAFLMFTGEHYTAAKVFTFTPKHRKIKNLNVSISDSAENKRKVCSFHLGLLMGNAILNVQGDVCVFICRLSDNIVSWLVCAKHWPQQPHPCHRQQSCCAQLCNRACGKIMSIHQQKASVCPWCPSKITHSCAQTKTKQTCCCVFMFTWGGVQIVNLCKQYKSY